MRISDYSKSIDELSTDTVVLTMHEDEKPPKEISGLIDWRLHGILSRTLKRNWFKCEKFDTCLIPVRTKFMARRILLLGAGKKGDWKVADALSAGTKVAEILKGLDVHEAALWCHKASDESEDRKTKKEFLRGFELKNAMSDIHVVWLEHRVLQIS